MVRGFLKTGLMVTVLTVFSSYVFSQSNEKKDYPQRLVLVEHWTQASCSWCPIESPPLYQLVKQNQGKVAFISYHTSWPGVDPMYNFNKANGQGDVRVNYYNIPSVPRASVAGSPNDQADHFYQSDIDKEYAKPGLFDISGKVTCFNRQLDINLQATAMQDFESGSVNAYVVLVEDKTYPIPPGTNGEKDFPAVMRYMFPGTDGKDIGLPKKGDIIKLNYQQEIPEEIMIDSCRVVAFIQNANHEVYMAQLFNIESNTGITDKNPAKPLFEVYPNPAKGMFTVKTSGKTRSTASLTITGINGNTVFQTKLSGNNRTLRIKSANFAPGLYIIRYTTPETTSFRKLIVR